MHAARTPSAEWVRQTLPIPSQSLIADQCEKCNAVREVCDRRGLRHSNIHNLSNSHCGSCAYVHSHTHSISFIPVPVFPVAVSHSSGRKWFPLPLHPSSGLIWVVFIWRHDQRQGAFACMHPSCLRTFGFSFSPRWPIHYCCRLEELRTTQEIVEALLLHSC